MASEITLTGSFKLQEVPQLPVLVIEDVLDIQRDSFADYLDAMLDRRPPGDALGE
jgi:hypothetical protein